MSMAALLQAVHSAVSASEDINPRQTHLELRCGINNDGQPIPACADQYISIYPTAWSPGNPPIEVGLVEEFSIGCMISVKPANPIDRRGLNFIQALYGLEPVARQLIKLISWNHDIITTANGLVSGADFISPLVWSGCDAAPVARDAEWFFSGDQTSKVSGYSLGVYFGGATRVQCLENRSEVE